MSNNNFDIFCKQSDVVEKPVQEFSMNTGDSEQSKYDYLFTNVPNVNIKHNSTKNLYKISNSDDFVPTNTYSDVINSGIISDTDKMSYGMSSTMSSTSSEESSDYSFTDTEW